MKGSRQQKQNIEQKKNRQEHAEAERKE